MGDRSQLDAFRRALRCKKPLVALATAVATWAVLVGFSGSALAQAIVLRSTVPGLTNGKVLSNDDTLSIPDGASATIALPSGDIRDLSGPFSAKTSELTRGSKADPAVFKAIRSFVDAESGQAKFGRARSFSSRAPASAVAVSPPVPFSWNAVPVSATGDVCIEKGAPLRLVRQQSRRALQLTVINMNSANRVRTQFAAGQAEIPWPSDLRLENGSFALVAPQQRMRQIRVRLIAPLPAAERTLRVLHGQRCKMQFQAYLRGKMVAQK